MKRLAGAAPFVALLPFFALPLSAQNYIRPSANLTVGSNQTAAAMNLAATVSEIANSHTLSRAKKEKRISTAVRVTVVGATAYRKNPSEVLETAIALGSVAAKAAPKFIDVIADAISFTPAIANIDGASGQIQAALAAAANGPAPRYIARHRPAIEPLDSTDAPHSRIAASSSAGSVARRDGITTSSPPSEEAGTGELSEYTTKISPARRRSYVASDDGEAPSRASDNTPALSLGENAVAHVSFAVSETHDDNVTLSQGNNKKADDIISVTPGVDLRFGQNSLAHGGVSYKEEIRRYAHKNGTDVSLGNGSADLSYNNGNVTVGANATYQQNYQANSDVAAAEKPITRSDTTHLDGSVETHVLAKTSVQTGADYNHTSYALTGLSGNHDIGWPVKVYYELTPKVDVSGGVTYRSSKVDGADRSSRDLYYNVGARGNFTPKLNGQVVVGYKTRSVGSASNDSTLGFDGTLNYELTPKTQMAATLNRGFSESALGESLKNTRISVNLTTTISPEWEVGVSISHSTDDYGTSFFSSSDKTDPKDKSGKNIQRRRNDSYWDGSIYSTYFITSWLNASATLTSRHNSSNVDLAEYSNNIFSLTLGLVY